MTSQISWLLFAAFFIWISRRKNVEVVIFWRNQEIWLEIFNIMWKSAKKFFFALDFWWRDARIFSYISLLPLVPLSSVIFADSSIDYSWNFWPNLSHGKHLVQKNVYLTKLFLNRWKIKYSEMHNDFENRVFFKCHANFL